VQEVHLIENAEKAGELLKPIRIKILSLLDTPRTCPEIARRLGLATQKVNYHMKVLRDAGLVRLTEEHRKRGIMEGVYQAVARSYWISPRLVGKLGGRSAALDQASLGFLLQLAEELQIDVGHLAETSDTGSIPSLGLDAQIELRDAGERGAFMEELKQSVQNLARKYGTGKQDKRTESKGFRLVLACYPHYSGNEDQ
jgi:predicted ArsR family transcriptional regulator